MPEGRATSGRAAAFGCLVAIVVVLAVMGLAGVAVGLAARGFGWALG